MDTLYGLWSAVPSISYSLKLNCIGRSSLEIPSRSADEITFRKVLGPYDRTRVRYPVGFRLSGLPMRIDGVDVNFLINIVLL